MNELYQPTADDISFLERLERLAKVKYDILLKTLYKNNPELEQHHKRLERKRKNTEIHIGEDRITSDLRHQAWDEARRELEKERDEQELRTLTIKDLKRAEQASPSPTPIEKEPPISFDAQNHCLFFLGKRIPITFDTDEFYLCQFLFRSKKTMTKEWSWDEVSTLTPSEAKQESKKWEKAYHARHRINIKVATETGIKDLFIGTTKTIKINPDYLEEKFK